MTEKAAGSSRKHALSQAPSWFIESCNRNLRSQNREEITIRGRKANDHRFTERQKKINREMEAKQKKPQNAIERVREQAKRLAASKKRSKR
jgi:hypothetical protein